MYNARFFSTKLGRAALISIGAMMALNAALLIGQLCTAAPGIAGGVSGGLA